MPGHCLCWPEDSCIKEKNDRGDRYTEEYPRESGQQKGKREEQQNCRNKGDVYRSSLDSGRRGSRRVCLKRSESREGKGAGGSQRAGGTRKGGRRTKESHVRRGSVQDAGGKESRTDCGGKGRSKRGRLSG